ncbi:hypothetical protein [Actinosynnema sp. NPDC023587]|uniref:hypothetical protein n=1 Tax=Actinosynnema sp. NPDC023587 TaxID=3154695 RepID=UPI0033FEF2EF
MFKRIATAATAVSFAALAALGTAGTASATGTPSASCINSDPTGLINVIVCTINTTVQVPIDLPESIITIGDIASGNDIEVLDRAQLDAVQVVVKDVLNNLSVEDNLVFKSAVVSALNNADIIDDIDISKVLVDIL